MTEPSETGRVVARLLGPPGPEVTCATCFDELDRYVELEASGADPDAVLPGFRAHLEGCPACREEHESLLALVRGGPLA
jgi:hypothetical protein